MELNHWLDNIKDLMKDFFGLTFNHVYMELNYKADFLSKVVLGKMDGKLHYLLFADDSVVREGQLVFF